MSINAIGHYAQRGLKMYPEFVFGTGHEVFANTLKKSYKGVKGANGQYTGGQGFKNFWQQFKDAGKAAEAHNKANIARNGGFFKNTWKQVSTTPAKVSQGWRVGGKLADKAGKTGAGKFWAQSKGALKGLGKRMPLIGSLLMVAFELPNIVKATKEKGLITGLGETAKAGARLGGAFLGAAIGQALIPIPVVGSLIGFIAGEWLTSKIVGKSYSEKKAEEEAKVQEQMAAMQQQQAVPNPFNQNIPFNGQAENTTATGNVTNPQMQQMPYMPNLTQAELMQLQKALYGGGYTNPMDEDIMARGMKLNGIA